MKGFCCLEVNVLNMANRKRGNMMKKLILTCCPSMEKVTFAMNTCDGKWTIVQLLISSCACQATIYSPFLPVALFMAYAPKTDFQAELRHPQISRK